MSSTRILLLCSLLCAHTAMFGQHRSIDLSGEWNFALDSTQIGEEQHWYTQTLPQTIHLPGSTDQAGYGTPHRDGTDLYFDKPETWQLARRNVYIGKAWYQKEITLPRNCIGKHAIISLERCLWQSKLWVNGMYAGESHSLCAPHTFDVTPFIRKGNNTLVMEIDNAPYVNLGTWSHGYSPGLQTIWNGAVGNLSLEVLDDVYLDSIQCYPSLKDSQIRIQAAIVNCSSKQSRGTLQITLVDEDGKEVLHETRHIVAQPGNNALDELFTLDASPLPWDEFTPHLYRLTLRSSVGKSRHEEQLNIGFRDISTENGRLNINGYTTFLRGEHDGGSFPLTGYPSMDKEDWLRILRTGKDYGLNHWRFHSWCPPEAAFQAADELGVYLQPELTLFSQDWENTLIGQDAARDDFLFSELQRLLDTYGNHPSFLVMCMGNELRGDAEVLERWVAWGKAHDDRHLYVSSANLEAMRKYLPLKGDQLQVAHAVSVNGRRYERRMGSYFNAEYPCTDKDYSHTLAAPYDQYPAIVHELGQWTVYPDYKEIAKYTGVLAPRNLEVFRERLEQKGMLDQADDFLHSSGKLSAALYREEIERALRTQGLSGFQLLDLRDYPAQGSALVGLLNVFWESKGIISPEEFRQSCGPLTLLLKMSKRVWQNDETFKAEIVAPNYLPSDLHDINLEWSISHHGKTLATERQTVPLLRQGDVNTCGFITLPLSQWQHAVRLDIALAIPSLGVKSSYPVWVYPTGQEPQPGDVTIARQATPELLDAIRDGARVLLVPEHLTDGERMTFTTPFWSSILFDYQPKTMGILCDPKHALFREFPTDPWSDWQWWELTAHATAMRINNTPDKFRPIVQVIDHPDRNDKLAAIVETAYGKGSLLVCTLDILSDLERRPVSRQLLCSILNYMNSADYRPAQVPEIIDLIFQTHASAQYATIEASGSNPDHPILHAFDNDDQSYWQMPVGTPQPIVVKIELAQERYVTGCHVATAHHTSTPPFKVYVADGPDDTLDTPVIISDGRSNVDHMAELWDNGFTIQRGKKGKYITIQFQPAGHECSLCKFDWLFGD